jgi:hypothetical protein
MLEPVATRLESERPFSFAAYNRSSPIPMVLNRQGNGPECLKGGCRTLTLAAGGVESSAMTSHVSNLCERFCVNSHLVEL